MEAPAPPAPSIDPAPELAETERLTLALMEGSKVKNKAACRALAEAAAVSQLHLRSLHARRAAGKLPAEESRTIPAVISGLKRLLAELGHVAGAGATGAADEDEAEGFRPPPKK